MAILQNYGIALAAFLLIIIIIVILARNSAPPITNKKVKWEDKIKRIGR